jgi:hypothetical protein
VNTRILRLASLLLLFFAMAGGVGTATAADFVSASAKKHQQANVTCVNCHGTAKPVAAAAATACSKCHTSSGEIIYIGTGMKKYVGDGGTIKTVNVHQSHLVELPCTECHKTHTASVNACNQCHAFKDMPLK